MTIPLMIIDPIVLGIPKGANSSNEEFTGYLENIIALQSFVQTSEQIKFAITSCVQNALEECEIFPFGKRIEDLLVKHNLTNVWSVGDLVRALNMLLSQSGIVEDEIGVKEALYDNVSITPKHAVNCAEKPLEQSRERALILGTLPHTSYTTKDRLTFYLTSAEPDDVQVAFRLHELEGEDVDSSQPLPHDLDEQIKLTNWTTRFTEYMSSTDLWHYAECTEEIHLSIQIAAWKFMRTNDKDTTLEEIPKFSIGQSFFESLVKHDAAHEGKSSAITLEACGRLIAGLQKSPLKPFIGTNGKQKLRSKDNAKAWRSHLAKRHEALRLMIWELSDGSYEFANIGNKNELTIY